MQSNTIVYDQELLQRFEEQLDPYNPGGGELPAHVLGYGEMSTVMTIAAAGPHLVFKRMPMFHTQSELSAYLGLYNDYLQHLTAAGVETVPAAISSVTPPRGNIAVYIIQERLDGRALVSAAIHNLPEEGISRLFERILDGIDRVFAYNDAGDGQVAIGFDAQMSNWAIAAYEPEAGALPEPLRLLYIDTSSPLLQLNHVEQLDPELFLRSAPSFLRWIIRLLFVDDVLNRYYDRRQVVIDVLANLYKEKRDDMIPALVERANRFLEARCGDAVFEPLSGREIAGYYKEDARIWRVYSAFRRADRTLHRLRGKPYPYVLPGPVER